MKKIIYLREERLVVIFLHEGTQFNVEETLQHFVLTLPTQHHIPWSFSNLDTLETPTPLKPASRTLSRRVDR